MSRTDFDVIILGAGLSGIGAACRLSRSMPDKRFTILERRQAIGGTWDLFKYPGIRSDSDMTTFGYSFKPWKSPRLLADGPSIKCYVTEAAEEHDVVRHIRFQQEIEAVEWCSSSACWTISCTDLTTGQVRQLRAKYVINGTGYYDHKQAHAPEFPQQEAFQGQLIHPQFWPQDLNYEGKKVVVIGSGATAVTLVPNMAQHAAKVTMLQRSPGYVINLPALDPVYLWMSKFMPVNWVFAISRIRNVLLGRLVYQAAGRWPGMVRRLLLKGVRNKLDGHAEMKHFEPRYQPWQQRLCAVPDGDMFQAIIDGKAEVVTDTIEKFTASGLRLKSGEQLEADIIVTATGLQLLAFGGATVKVDGQAVALSERMLFKGMLIEGVPNFLHINGYFNASWTLKADIVTDHFLRLMQHMDKTQSDMVTAHAGAAPRLMPQKENEAGYIQRGAHTRPMEGERKPWAALSDYLSDALQLKFGRVTHPALDYRKLDEKSAAFDESHIQLTEDSI